MGLCNAPDTFHTSMNKILQYWEDAFMGICMYDLHIFSKYKEIHNYHLSIVL